jgi:hypothetical protein
MGTAVRRDELWNTLHAGDWACAHADDAGLGRIANGLAIDLDGEMERTARRVAFLAARDMSSASLLWGELARRLRALREERVELD